ncbi:MAG: PAS domain S-box protein [Candidatus Sedimenticola sp. 20ELBAFRAG]
MLEHFGERLGQILRERGIRPSKITRDLGISRQSLYNWLGGGNISASNVGRLVDYLDVDRLWLLEGVGSPSGEHDGEGVYGAHARSLIKNVVNNEIRLKLASKAAGLAIWEYDIFRDRLSWAGESNPLCDVDLTTTYSDLDSFIAALAETDRERFSVRLRMLLAEGGNGFEEVAIELPDGCVRNIAVWLTVNKDAMGRPLGVTGAIQDITERILNQKALTQSELRLRSLVESCPFGVGMAREGKVIYANQACLDMFGYKSAQELHGRLITDQVAPHCREEILDKAKRRLAGETVPSSYETEGLRCNGEIFPMQMNASLLEFPDGPVNVGFFNDLTQRKQAEAALRDSEAQLRLITDSLPVLIAYVDSDLHFQFINKEFERWYDSKDLVLQGMHVKEVMTGEGYQAVLPYMHRVLNGETVRFEAPLPLPGGSGRYVQVIYVPDGAAENSVKGFFALVSDITERKRMEEAVSAREAQLRKAQEIALLGKWSLDVKTQQCTLSDSAMEILGFPEEGDHSPDLMYELIHPEDRERWEQSFKNAITGNEDYDVHYRVLRSDGDVRHISARAELLTDDEGIPVSMFGIVQDVTEQKSRENRLRDLNRTYEMLSHCNKSVIRATSEEQLLNEFCQHIVETGGYRMAWVGCAQQDEDKTIKPMAVAGADAGYVMSAKLTWDDTPRGRGPGGTAIRTGVPSIIRDVHSDPSFEPWREDAVKRGFGSVMAFPLGEGGDVCGVLLIYAKGVDAFDSEEIQLLENLAEDLSYGVHALRARVERDKAQRALEESEQRFRDFTVSASDWFWEIGPDLRFTYLSEQFFATTGIDPEHVIGKRCEDLAQVDLGDQLWIDHLQDLKQRLPFKDFQFWHAGEDGERRCASMSGLPIYSDDGEFMGFRGTASNVTGQIDTQDELRLAAAVFDSTIEGVMVVDLDGTIIAVNKAFSDITGYIESEALGQKPSMLKSQRHDREFYENMWATILATGVWQGEIWNRRKNGEVYPEWLNISAVKNERGDVIRYVSVFSDITAKKQSEERLTHLAHHDALTGLPNRLLFNALLEHTLERVERNGEQVAVLFMDLDLFKNINDSFGHPIGDRLLQLVAERLMSVVRDEDTVARVGGDEFILLLERVGNMQAAATVSEKLLHELHRPFVVDGQEMYMTASIGISISPNDSLDGDVLIKNADAAMYRAKEQGRGQYCFYTEELTVSAMERVLLERDLRQALIQNQLVVHYQPQYSLRTGKLVGAEALVRWQHPEKGLISPDSFIHVAEECGLILPLGEWVLRESTRQMRKWMQDGLAIGRVSVNVSGQQIERADLVAMVKETLCDTGLQPWHLELEITESCIMQEAESAIKALAELKMMGVRLAVDDFGTGYSSLSYLKRLPIHKLKIDRSFIRDIPHDPNDEAISRAVLALGHSLQLEIVAEGVETLVQEEFLKETGCDEVQGYLYSPPVSAEEFEALVKAGCGLCTSPKMIPRQQS